MTKTALAAEIGISTRQMTAYEHGEQPSPLTLERMVRTLHFPTAFFGGDDLDQPPEDATSFRALTTLTARQRHQARAAAALAKSFADWIDQRFELPAATVPQYLGVDPETAAMAVRSEWGIGERPIRNAIHAVEARGVRVFSLPEECASVDAFSCWRGSTPYMFLNTTKSAEHRRMDVAHELGHLVLHGKAAPHGREAEREAADFAAAFLMPTASVKAEAPRSGALQDIIAAKRRWGVSAAALTYRMRHLEPPFLTDWQYRMLFVEMSRKGFLVAEPNEIQPEASRLWWKVLDALRGSGTTLAQVAEELRLFPDDLNRLLLGLVLAPIEGMGGPMTGSSERPALRIVEPIPDPNRHTAGPALT